MELLLIRHAEPVSLGTPGGPADPPLHERGRDQRDRLAEFLGGEEIHVVWSSPLRRCRETAAALAGATGSEILVDEGLAEFDRHASDYVPLEEWAPGEPRWAALKAGRLHELFGIDPETARAQAVAAVERVVAAHPGQRAAVVCHAGVINAYLAHVLGIPTPLFFRPHYAALSRVAAGRDGARTVLSLNEHGHVRDLLRRARFGIPSSPATGR